MNREYRSDIDALKGLAIIAVILYHVGMLPYGFLGVDTFLVINGFLIIPALIRQIHNGEFKFFPWLSKRIFRLWPIVLIASIVCLIIGYWMMIPDSYENLAESVVASNTFSNNILSAITTGNYWNTANEFKPLMQMWYLGVVVQFYILYPIIILLCNKCLSRFKTCNNFWLYIVAIIGLISLSLYLLYPDAFSNKFYFVQYRVWEFSIGGVIGLSVDKFRITSKKLAYIGYVLLCLLFILNAKSISQIDTITVVGMNTPPYDNVIKMVLTITTTLITGSIILINFNWGGVFLQLGKMSLSLFVWHQVILAFIRYGFIEKFNWSELFVYLIITLVVAFVSYKYIEPIKAKRLISKISIGIVFLVTTCTAFMIYRNAGVVRDVPELGISVENPYANRNTEYIDQVYKWKNTFESKKPHVLVVGNSFARDFACILMEYDKAKKLEMAYAFDFDKVDSVTIANTDYLFVFGPKSKIPEKTLKQVPHHCQTFGIGTKKYGKNFGIFYTKRNTLEYFEQSIKSHPIVDSLNSEWKQEWGAHSFIDLMDAARLPNGTIRIFTPEHKAISFDCGHLTQDGCKFYATRLNLDRIFNNENK